MIKHRIVQHRWISLISIGYLFLIVSILATGCDLANLGQSPGYQETLVNIQIQQTMLPQEQNNALQLTLTSQNSTLQAQMVAQATQPPQPSPALPTPDMAVALQETVQAIQSSTQAASIPTAIIPTQTSSNLEPSPTIDVLSMMKSANILLYEDMVAYSETNRYVKDTLDRMGLTYKDDGNAMGWLKSDMLNGAPNGEPWDLVIIAAEAKTSVQGEFFEYIMDVMDEGSSVILEVWYLDQVAGGVASSLLEKCGVQFDKDWSKVPPSRMVMFTLDSSHPVMRQPNSSLAFTRVTSYWWDETLATTYDIGDWMKITSRGDAQLLVGTIATEKTTHGTVTACMDDRLILQTFSSHQLSFDAMYPVWENYIYNALKVRFENNHP